MPCQVSWQSVAIKPQPSVHGLGAEAAAAAGGPVEATSAAEATPQELPAAMIAAAKNAELCIASLRGSTCAIVSRYKIGGQESTGVVCPRRQKFRSEWQLRHSHLKGPAGSAATVAAGQPPMRMSALGQTQKSGRAIGKSASPSRADIVRFGPSGPKSARSGNCAPSQTDYVAVTEIVLCNVLGLIPPSPRLLIIGQLM